MPDGQMVLEYKFKNTINVGSKSHYVFWLLENSCAWKVHEIQACINISRFRKKEVFCRSKSSSTVFTDILWCLFSWKIWIISTLYLNKNCYSRFEVKSDFFLSLIPHPLMVVVKCIDETWFQFHRLHFFFLPSVFNLLTRDVKNWNHVKYPIYFS